MHIKWLEQLEKAIVSAPKVLVDQSKAQSLLRLETEQRRDLTTTDGEVILHDPIRGITNFSKKKRTDLRVNVKQKVVIHCGRRSYEVLMENISASGAYIACNVFLWEGEAIDIEMSLNNAPITISAEVVRVETGLLESYFGYGLKFSDLGKTQEEIIRNFVFSLQKGKYHKFA